MARSYASSRSYAWPRITPGHEVCLSKGDSWPKLMPGQELGLSTRFAWPVMTLDEDACVARSHARQVPTSSQV